MSDSSEEKSSRPTEMFESAEEDFIFDEYYSESNYPRRSRAPSIDERNFKHIFKRPPYIEPRHPILSSPFCRHIAAMAYGPTKPPWYQSLASSQLYLFKDLINYVTVGRSGYFRFDDFMDALQDFDSTITRAEVVGILENVETNEYEELDFGKFLFLLAYNDQVKESDSTEESLERLSSPTVTARQCLILSAISYFVLITTRGDIQRYYYDNTRRKATVLHNHIEAARLDGLSETEMEKKQKDASANLEQLYRLTASPYAMPVPFLPGFKKGQIYKEWKKYGSKSHKIEKKRAPTIPLNIKRALGDPLVDQTEHEKMISSMIYGNIPLPEMHFPRKIIDQVRKGGFTVQLKDYLMEKAECARKEYKQLLKDAGVLCGHHYLRPILNQGFPTHGDRDTFIEIYQRYFPLDVKDWKNYSLWVKPLDFKVGNRGPLYPDKVAFGRTLK